MHGNPVQPLVLDTVRDISRYRVNSAFSVALNAFSTSTPLAAALDRRAEDRERRMSELRRGTSLLELWEQTTPGGPAPT